MTRCTAFLFVYLFSHEAGAQFSVYANGVVGTYGMGSMKNFQRSIAANFAESGIDARPVLEFPASVQFEAGFNWLPEPFVPSIGGFVNHARTMGKVLYRDYSGETYTELDLTRWVFGGRAARTFENGFGIYGKIGVNKTAVSIAFVTQVGDFDPDVEITEFYSGGFSAEPGISWIFTIGRFGLSALAGLELNVQGKTRSKEDHKVYLITSNGQQILANWTGLRTGLDVSFRFSKTEAGE